MEFLSSEGNGSSAWDFCKVSPWQIEDHHEDSLSHRSLSPATDEMDASSVLDSSRASSPPWSCNASTCTASTEDNFDWLYNVVGASENVGGSPAPERQSSAAASDNGKDAIDIEIPSTCKKCADKGKHVRLSKIPHDVDYWVDLRKSRQYLDKFSPHAHCALCSRIFCVCSICKSPMFPTRNHLSDLESHLRACKRKALNARARSTTHPPLVDTVPFMASPAKTLADGADPGLVQACTVLYNSKDFEESQKDLEALKSLLMSRFQVKQRPGRLSMVTLLCLDVLHRVRSNIQEKTIRDQLSSHLGRLLVDIASSDSSLESAEADVVQALQTACRVSKDDVASLLGIDGAVCDRDDAACEIVLHVVGEHLKRTNIFDWEAWNRKTKDAQREFDQRGFDTSPTAPDPEERALARTEFVLGNVNKMLESRFQYAVCGFSAVPSNSYALFLWSERLFSFLFFLLVRYDAATRLALSALGFKLVVSTQHLLAAPSSSIDVALTPEHDRHHSTGHGVSRAQEVVADFMSRVFHGQEGRALDSRGGTLHGSGESGGSSAVSCGEWLLPMRSRDGSSHRGGCAVQAPEGGQVLQTVLTLASASMQSLSPVLDAAGPLVIAPHTLAGRLAAGGPVPLSSKPQACQGRPPLPPAAPRRRVVLVEERGVASGDEVGKECRCSAEACLPTQLTAEEIKRHFHLPLEVAAERMGVCLEAARRACAKIGIRNWPHSLIVDDDAGAVCNFGGRAPNSGIAALDRGRNAPPLLLDLAALEKINKGIANGRAVHWLKLAEAAAALGASSLALRRACRRLGIAKWPSRQPAHKRMRHVIKVRTRSNRLCHNLPPPSLLRLAEAPA